MKKQIPVGVVVATLVVVVVAIGVYLFQQVSTNPATPRPDPKYFGVKPGGASSGGATSTNAGGH